MSTSKLRDIVFDLTKSFDQGHNPTLPVEANQEGQLSTNRFIIESFGDPTVMDMDHQEQEHPYLVLQCYEQVAGSPLASRIRSELSTNPSSNSCDKQSMSNVELIHNDKEIRKQWTGGSWDAEDRVFNKS
jgi:hypothetical protein